MPDSPSDRLARLTYRLLVFGVVALLVVQTVSYSRLFAGLLVASFVNVCVWISVSKLARVWWPQARGAWLGLASGVGLVALILVVTLFCGLTSRFRIQLSVEYLVMFSAGLAMLLTGYLRVVRRPPSVSNSPPMRIPWTGALVAGVLAATWIASAADAPAEASLRLAWPAQRALHQSTESLTELYQAYHWVRDASIHVVSLPFDDPAAPYAPANGTALMAWLMALMVDDSLARWVQFPLAALAALATGLLTGADRLRWWPALMFVVLPVVVVESLMPTDSLLAAAMALCSCALARRYARTGEFGSALFGALALAVYLGCGLAPLLFAPVVLLVWTRAFSRRFSRQALAVGAALALLLGFFWHGRNLVMTGNPVYPIQVSFGDRALLQGTLPMDRLGWPDTPQPAGPLDHLTRAYVACGPAGLSALLIGMTVALVRCLRQRRRPLSALGDHGTPIIWLALSFLFVPQPHQWAHLIPAFGMALAALDRMGGRHDLTVGPGTWVLLLAIGWPGPLWGGLSGLPFASWDWTLPALAFGAAVAGICCLLRGPRTCAWGRPAGVALTVIILCWASAGGLSLDPPQFPRITPTPRDRQLARLWQFVEQNAQAHRIAFAGPVIPYRMIGRALENDVSYLPLVGPPRMMPHELDGWLREHPPLNWSSRELRIPPRAPVPDRMRWTRRIFGRQVHWLVLGRLPEHCAGDLLSDSQGFPREHAWAERPFRVMIPTPDQRSFIPVWMRMQPMWGGTEEGFKVYATPLLSQ